ncbi:hypothetical protein Mapa_017762 [Marchantia paleacea]|nr:hypothetical protein Mapa_017762 [Marchantia paleacea]
MECTNSINLQKGFTSVRVIFFHGFQKEDCDDAYVRTWMKADESECWLDTWLAEDFPSAHILSVSYDSGRKVSDCRGRMGMYVLAENLARNIVGIGGLGDDCSIVLVGFCVGGLVLKEVCLKIFELEKRETILGQNRYANFLKRLKGAFFFATAHSGSGEVAKSDEGGPLVEYVGVLNEKAARTNSEFSILRHQKGWKTWGVCEDIETNLQVGSLKKARHSSACARYDVDEFRLIPGADHETICKPDDKEASSYLFLVNFLQTVSDVEKEKNAELRLSLEFPPVLLEAQVRLDGVIRTLHLQNPEVIGLAVVGMGGIGKSILAKQVMMHIAPRFEYICFVQDTKRSIKRKNLITLVADNLFRGDGRRVSWQSSHTVRRLLRGKKAFLILDDCGDIEDQIRCLLEPDWLGQGSRVLITSRIQTTIPGFVTLDLPLFSELESQQLFELHLVDRVPNAMPKGLVKEIVEKCDGLPLTLEVIGSYLRTETDEIKWIEALERLRIAESLNGSADDKLWQRLRVSYDELGELEQRIFVDLAVFDLYNNEEEQYDVDVLIEAWRTKYSEISPEAGLRTLQDRFFIRVGPYFGAGRLKPYNRFYLHEQLRDMGKSISRPVDENPELCKGIRHPDDALHMLKKYNHKGEMARTEVLTVEVSKESTATCSHLQNDMLSVNWSVIRKMQQLRLLRMVNVNIAESSVYFQSDSPRLPGSLVMLHLINCSESPRSVWSLLDTKSSWPLRKVDVDALHRVSVLLLENCTAVRLPDNIHNLSNLKILEIHVDLLAELPERLGLLPALEHLSLRSALLEKLPNSFLQLSTLKTLTIDGCLALKMWPTSEVLPEIENNTCSLTSLNTLILNNLPSLTRLPSSFSQLKSLQTLLLTGCSALKKLPESFGELQKLHLIALKGCSELETLPESFSGLNSLEALFLNDLPALPSLPNSLKGLTSLQKLKIQSCPLLKRLPEGLGEVHQIEELSIIKCDGLEYLCQNFGNWGINRLYINGCKRVRCLPDSFGCISLLNLVYNQQLQILPESVSKLTSLKSLEITFCDMTQGLLQSLEHDQLTNLEFLYLQFLDRYEGLPNSFGRLQKLKELFVTGCTFHEALAHSLGKLTSLEGLFINDCDIKYLPESLAELTRLRQLEVSECENFKTLPDCIGRLTDLTNLEISNCKDFQGLPESVKELVSSGNLTLGFQD